MTLEGNKSTSNLVFQTDMWIDASRNTSGYLALYPREEGDHQTRKVEQVAKEILTAEPPAKRARVEPNLQQPNDDWLLCDELTEKETAKFSCVSEVDPKSRKKIITLRRLDKEQYLYVKKLVLEKHENGFTSIFLDFDDYSAISYLLYTEYKKVFSPPYISFNELRIASIWESIKNLNSIEGDSIFTRDQIKSVESCLHEEYPFSGSKPTRKKGT